LVTYKTSLKSNYIILLAITNYLNKHKILNNLRLKIKVKGKRKLIEMKLVESLLPLLISTRVQNQGSQPWRLITPFFSTKIFKREPLNLQ